MLIRTKITLQFFAIASGILILLSLATYYFSYKFQEQDFYQKLENRAITTADLLLRVEEIDSALLKLIDTNKKDIYKGENISVYDAEQRELYTNNDSVYFSNLLPDFSNLVTSLPAEEPIFRRYDTLQICAFKYEHQGKPFVVMAGAVDEETDHFLRNLSTILLLVDLIAMIILVLTGWWFAGRALSPVKSIITQARTITDKNLNSRLDEGNHKDELSQLAQTFNELLTRLDKAFAVQKTFVANASHELRNPLTSITTQLEVGLMKQRDTTEYEALLASVLEDIKILNQLSYDLLNLTKLESDTAGLDFEKISPDELLWEVRQNFLRNHPDCKVILQQQDTNEVYPLIRANPRYLSICLYNLLDNACKFSPDRSAQLILRVEQGKIIITVSDKGPGISPEDQEHIFEPFYRGAGSARSKGYGIGLHLVHKIVSAHQGTIAVLSVPQKGTNFLLSFPST